MADGSISVSLRERKRRKTDIRRKKRRLCFLYFPIVGFSPALHHTQKREMRYIEVLENVDKRLKKT